MKLTAALAYSQLKVNFSRSLWTLVGIILSTTLITTISSFTASIISLVFSLSGSNVADSHAMIVGILMIPAVILGTIIVLVAVIVTSNAFSISAAERMKQFGILKSVGATKQQIISTVMYESIILSLIGIPAGILCGLLLTFVGTQVINHFLNEINSLTQIMIQEFSIHVNFVFSWNALIISFLISFLTIIVSAWIPARKAAKFSAIHSIRGVLEVTIKSEVKMTKKYFFIQKIFGFEGTLAAKTLRRNRRNLRASIRSLTISIVLVITVFFIGTQASDIENLLYQFTSSSIVVEYASSAPHIKDEVTGAKKRIVTNPIESKQADMITKRLREFESTSIFGVGVDLFTFETIIRSDMLTLEMNELMKKDFPENQTEFQFARKLPVELITVDPVNYSLLCKQAGVSYGSNILINYYNYNDNGNEKIISPFVFQEGMQLTITSRDSSVEMPIHGFLSYEKVPIELMEFHPEIVRLLVPSGKMRNYSWFANPTDLDRFTNYAHNVLDELFPKEQELAYMEQGFSTRVFETEDYMKVMNIPISMGLVLAWSLVIILTLIGFTSVITTMSMNVQKRYCEFAILKSVGMTEDGLKKMLNLESILCSLKSLVIGLPTALILTFLINMSLRSSFPVPYQLPWIAIIWCMIGVFVVTWLTMRISLSRLNKKSIIDIIRTESEY